MCDCNVGYLYFDYVSAIYLGLCLQHICVKTMRYAKYHLR